MTAPAYPPDPKSFADVRRLVELESAFAQQRMVALRQMAQGQPVSDEALEIVVQQILPQCRRTLQSVSISAAGAPADDPRHRLREFARLHEQAWQAFERAARTHDFDQAQLHVRLMAESMGLVAELTPAYGPRDPGRQLADFRRLVYANTPHIWAVSTIVVANVLVFVAMVAAGANLFMPATRIVLQWGANHGPLTLNGQWWRIFTCMFLHFGLLHIGFNMFILWQIGRLVERLVGNVGFLILYVASGMFASIASLAWNPLAISAGASGAVFGVCGALLGFIALRRDSIPGVVLKNLRGSLLTFVIYNVAFGIVVPAIDMAAHLGGLVAGFLCGLLLSQPIVAGAGRQRWKRNALCAAASAVVLPVAFGLLPTDRIRGAVQIEAIQSLNVKANEVLQQQARLHTEKVIDDAGLAEALEQRVAPLWEDALRELQPEPGTADRDPILRRELEQYLRLQLDGTRMLARGLQHGDARVQREAQARLQAAVRKWKAIVGDGRRTGSVLNPS